MAETKQFCIFQLGGFSFGIEPARVQEVLKSHEWTPVPLAAAGIQGVMNLRGQIVTVLDVRTYLALPPREEDRSPVHMILRSRNENVSLLVDRIGDVVEAEQDSFEDPPATLPENIRRLIQGAYKLKGQLLLVLNLEEALRVKN